MHPHFQFVTIIPQEKEKTILLWEKVLRIDNRNNSTHLTRILNWHGRYKHIKSNNITLFTLILNI